MYLQFTKTLYLSLFFLVTPAWASVGYILTLNGQPSDFELLRKTRPETVVAVVANQPLKVNDKIQVLKQSHSEGTIKRDSSLLLLLGNRELVNLTYQNTHPEPYLVQASQELPTVLGGFMTSLETWFKGLQEHQVHLLSVYTKGTSKNPESLTMPLLTGNAVKLLTGKTTLSLGWSGGQAPYQVQVSQEGASQSWSNPSSTTTSVTLGNFKATLGRRYLVEVKDAAGQSVKATFDVVADSSILNDPQAQAIQGSPSSESRQVLLASWLAQQPGWRLEAYQQVAGIAGKFYPAKLVKEGLEAGK
jgi:hypothetical protein